LVHGVTKSLVSQSSLSHYRHPKNTDGDPVTVRTSVHNKA